MSIPVDATFANDKKIAIYRAADTPRFSARSKSLESPMERMTIRFGFNEGHNDRASIRVTGTSASYEDQMKATELTRFILLQGTAVREDLAWNSLPRINDYYPQEELYDIDEMDQLYLQAAKSRGW